MRLVVGPAAEQDALLRTHRPSHLLTLTSPGRAAELPAGSVAHLGLVFHDVVAPRAGLVPATSADVAALLSFGRGWDGTRPLLALCELGISRSPAAAFALACQARPNMPPAAIAAALRRAAPEATPNLLLVTLADQVLGRGGAMPAAVAAIGRGAEFAGPRSFVLDLGAASGLCGSAGRD